MKTKISFCMVVQDEERWIGFILEYIKKLADSSGEKPQIVIVDGGSKDNTLEIMRSFPDNRFCVYQNEWPGFADQLSFADSKCEGEWIWYNSGDLTATNNIFGGLGRLLVDDQEIVAYTFPQANLIQDTDHMVLPIDWIVNMRRNIPDFTWKAKKKSGNSLENLHYKGVMIRQHPSGLTTGVRVISAIYLIHWANLKNHDEKLAKYLKRRHLKGSYFYGYSEDLVKQICSKPEDFQEIKRTGRVVKIRPILEDYYGRERSW